MIAFIICPGLAAGIALVIYTELDAGDPQCV